VRSSVSITVIVMLHGRLRQARPQPQSHLRAQVHQHAEGPDRSGYARSRRDGMLVLACYRLDANRERLMTAIPLVAMSP
jgi:hypothetical protein